MIIHPRFLAFSSVLMIFFAAMKRNLIASLLFACAVILAVAAEVDKEKPPPSGEIKDPIISMIMASSIDDKGKLVNARFSFPQTEKQITAIVQLGNIKGSQLTLTWYQTSDEGDTKLFEHQIQVKSGERAFSVAKNPGRFFSAGTYKVVATLDGQTKEMEFDIISSKAAPKKTSNNSDERHFAGQTELENDRAVSAGTNSDGLFQPISYEPISHQGEVRKVASPQSGSAQPTPSTAVPGQPPVAGQSGTAPQPPKPPSGPTASGCAMTIGGENPELADILKVYSWCACTQFATIWVYANVIPPPNWFVGNYETDAAGTSQIFPVDPCKYYGGSDLPGTKVYVKAAAYDRNGKELDTISHVITLGDDTLAPRVHVVSTPARHSKVKPGDKIKLEVDATELRSGGSWQSGVALIEVKDEDAGVLVDSKTYLDVPR